MDIISEYDKLLIKDVVYLIFKGEMIYKGTNVCFPILL